MAKTCGLSVYNLVECSVPSSPSSNIVFPIVSTVSPSVVVRELSLHVAVLESSRFGRVKSSVGRMVDGRIWLLTTIHGSKMELVRGRSA